MKVLISKDKKGKQVVRYKAADGLIFDRKEHCTFYEAKHMWRCKSEQVQSKLEK